MYANPALLQPVSNREDFLLTMQLYDDDTFQPISLTGISTPNGQAFAGASWTVIDGAIVTSSVTPITIPAFPTGAQLSALALTVGVGLGILSGDPITIKDTPTGLNIMAGYVASYASATGKMVCQIGWTFQFEIRRVPAQWSNSSGYSYQYDVGGWLNSPILQASLANGEITVVDLGTIQIRIPEATFKTLHGGTYAACLTMTDSVNTRQLFIGKLPVLHGGVSQ